MSQPGEAVAFHPGLQFGQLDEKAGAAGVGEALVFEKRANQPHQDRPTSHLGTLGSWCFSLLRSPYGKEVISEVLERIGKLCRGPG